MSVGLIYTCHVASGSFSHFDRVIFMFHTRPLPKRRMEEIRRIPCRVNIGNGCLQALIHDNPVIDLEAGLFCQVKVGMDADPSYYSICLDDSPASRVDYEPVSFLLDAGSRIPCQHLHTFLAIIIIYETREI